MLRTIVWIFESIMAKAKLWTLEAKALPNPICIQPWIHHTATTSNGLDLHAYAACMF